MISKEKIKNLFDKNIPIYGIDYRRCLQPDIVKIPVRNLRYCPSNDNYQYLSSKDGDCYLYEFFNEDLYETQEDAEFAKEFKNIEHTETLDLPLFDNLPENFDISFVRFDKEMDCWIIYELYIEFNEICILFRDVTEEASDCIFREPLTKENYLEACKISKNLFLGNNE